MDKFEDIKIYIDRVVKYYNLGYSINIKFRVMRRTWANIGYNTYNKTATITISHNLLIQPDEKMCHTITHEVLHLVFPNRGHCKKFQLEEEKWLNSYGLTSKRNGFHVNALLAADKIVWNEKTCPKNETPKRISKKDIAKITL